jgi:tRNA-Thr(GGU) m(6)t(6)A37 methyltransferase TsaA
MPEEIRSKLKKLYSKQVDKNTYEGSFRENLPDDVGGFGRYVHLGNPMGDVYIYVERFRGNDAQAPDIEKAFDATDYLVDSIIDWLEFELGDNPNFEKLRVFCNEELREDAKNLTVYMWMGNRVSENPEEDTMVRMMLYLYERDYFTLGDISSFVASTNQEAWILSYLRRLTGKKLGYSNTEEVVEELEFLKDRNTVQQSVSRFLKSPKMYDKVIQEARERSGDSNLIVDPNWFDDSNNIGELLFEIHGIELETFFLDFEIFGGNPDKINIKLDCPRKPFETNGKWDDVTKQLSWSKEIEADQLPFVCYATIGTPNGAFQSRHFGGVILTDEQLLPYAFWYEGLSNRQKEEWDGFLVSLDPNEGVQSKVKSFRFRDAPQPSPGRDGAAKLLSDLPRNLIIEGMNMHKKDRQEPDSKEPVPAQQQSFTVYPIGKVEKKDGRTFIVIDKEYEAGLKGLEKHSYVHVVYWFDRNDTPEKRSILQVNPRGDRKNPLTGVFATHSPFRPNLIAISRCDIISIRENVIEIKDIDAFDESPVLDLKGDFFRFYRPNTK